MKVLAKSLLTMLAMCGATQAQQSPAQTSPGTSGQQGMQNPGRPATNPSGQTGVTPNGQSGQQGGQNPVNIPGRTPVGQNPVQQPGQGTGNNPLGPIGPVGQPGQNPIGQPGSGVNGMPGRNTIGQNVGINARPTTGQMRALYQNADIGRTLNLTADQLDRLNAANARIQQGYQTQLSRLESLTPGQREIAMQQLRASQLNDFYKSANGVFTPEQLRRYQQLEYQYQGPAAFTDPTVRTRLSLTDDQVRQFQLMQQNALNAQSFLQNADGTIRNNGMAEYSAYRRLTNEQMDAILSQEQRDRWRSMIGEPYNFGPYVSSIYVR